MTYWDTSCLLKLYVQEADSDAYRDILLQQTTPLLTSALAEVEFAFALTRRESEGQLKKGAAAHLVQLLRNHASQGRIRFIPIHATVRDLATSLVRRCLLEQHPPLQLRTLDGIHLATALSLKASRLLTADLRLRAAARLCGLDTGTSHFV